MMYRNFWDWTCSKIVIDFSCKSEIHCFWIVDLSVKKITNNLQSPYITVFAPFTNILQKNTETRNWLWIDNEGMYTVRLFKLITSSPSHQSACAYNSYFSFRSAQGCFGKRKSRKILLEKRHSRFGQFAKNYHFFCKGQFFPIFCN